MTVLDAYALISLLGGGVAQRKVEEILRTGTTAVATTSLAETIDVLARRYRVAPEASTPVIERLLEGTISPVPLDVSVAVRAGSLRARHYHRTDRPLSLADCVALASAAEGDSIATADPAMLAAARADGIAVVQLPAEP